MLRARAKSVAAIALTAGLRASIRAIDASTSSTGEISLVPMRRRISTDDSASNSSDGGIISNPGADRYCPRHPCGIALRPLLKLLHQTLQQPRARFDRGEQHVFMISMCAVAIHAKPVQGWGGRGRNTNSGRNAGSTTG